MSELYKTTKWLKFIVVDRKPKTIVMHVLNKSGEFLGMIKWYPAWRQYSFFTPETQLTFNNGCLQDITDVLTELNDTHKKDASNVR